MSDNCDYFNSPEWDETLDRLQSRVMNLKMIVWSADYIDDTENALEDLVAHLGVSRHELNEKPVGETLSSVPEGIIKWNGRTIEEAREEIIRIPDSCPHEAVKGSNRCLFHMSPEQRSECDITAEEVQREFLRKVSERGEKTKDFTGANFSYLDLESESLSAADNFPIRLVGVKVEGELNLSRAVIDQPLLASGAEFGAVELIDSEFNKDVEFWGTDFNARTSFKYCIFRNDAEFWNTRFRGPVSFYAGSFEEYAEFRDATFESEALFKYTEVERDIEFWDAIFKQGGDFESMAVRNCAEFRYATFEDVVSFESVAIDDRAEFRRAHFRADASFEHLKVGGDCHFWGTEFGGKVHVRAAKFGNYLEFKENDLNEEGKSAVFYDDANFRYSSIERDVEFWGVEFQGDADFRNIEFGGTTEFQYSTFYGTADFTESNHSDINFTEVKSTESDIQMIDNSIPAGEITQPPDGSTYYDMSHATLGDLQLEGDTEADIFEYYRFYETYFENFPFPEYRRALNKSWEIHRYKNPGTESEYDKLESTYLKAKNGANEVGDSRAASEFFLREFRYQRKDHWRNFSEPGGLLDRLRSLFSWGANWMYNLTCGYGERPFRTVGFSFVLILLFAIAYEIIGVQFQTADSLITSLIFSLQTFVALILGGTTPTNQTFGVQFLVALEAFFGAFAIALFVFSLTRSLHR